jgi:hypothetical protein
MDALSPAVADACDLLWDDLDEHLCEAETLAEKFPRWSEADTDSVRALIPDLVLVIRGLLIEHQPRPSGACRPCSSTWPCSVVTTIHGLVKSPDRAFAALINRARDGE